MLRTQTAAALVALLLTWCAAAHAAKPIPDISPAAPAQLRRLGTHHPARAQSTCIPGAVGPGVFAVNYLLPPNDVYYTLVRCDACAPDSASIREVHVALRFPVACDQPVAITFVATNGDTACPEPNALIALLESVTFQLSAPEAGDYDFGLTLPRAMRVAGEVFLCVNFATDGGSQCSSLTTRPQLLTTGSCQTCRSWNDSVAGRQDLCEVLLPGQPVMYGVVESCGGVATRHRSWGTLKLLYR